MTCRLAPLAKVPGGQAHDGAQGTQRYQVALVMADGDTTPPFGLIALIYPERARGFALGQLIPERAEDALELRAVFLAQPAEDPLAL